MDNLAEQFQARIRMLETDVEYWKRRSIASSNSAATLFSELMLALTAMKELVKETDALNETLRMSLKGIAHQRAEEYLARLPATYHGSLEDVGALSKKSLFPADEIRKGN